MTKDGVTKAIKLILSTGEGEQMRKNVEQLQDLALDAVSKWQLYEKSRSSAGGCHQVIIRYGSPRLEIRNENLAAIFGLLHERLPIAAKFLSEVK
ncbi:hypothetical protein OIU84_000666 [Salix udensis]|uniref:Uncharacterized protein n=1 Tax=Salix udensis TaxID=889485 RepID=A0AAD6L5E4_9ROSI|nr:hypothetical protein OIU84_000666 [Salix udensis]